MLVSAPAGPGNVAGDQGGELQAFHCVAPAPALHRDADAKFLGIFGPVAGLDFLPVCGQLQDQAHGQSERKPVESQIRRRLGPTLSC